MPVALPSDGDLAARVTRIAAITRGRNTPAARQRRYWGRCSGCWPPPGCSAGSSTASSLSTLSPPTCAARPSHSAFAGAPVRAVIPIPNTTVNVTVTFGALSYTRTLRNHPACRIPAGHPMWPCGRPPCAGTWAAQPADRRG